jgi:hypothetical protein
MKNTSVQALTAATSHNRVYSLCEIDDRSTDEHIRKCRHRRTILTRSTCYKLRVFELYTNSFSLPRKRKTRWNNYTGSSKMMNLDSQRNNFYEERHRDRFSGTTSSAHRISYITRKVSTWAPFVARKHPDSTHFAAIFIKAFPDRLPLHMC